MGRRTPFVALEILWSFSAGVASVHHYRELGRENRETKSPAKRKASGKTAKMSLDTITHLSGFRVNQELAMFGCILTVRSQRECAQATLWCG